MLERLMMIEKRYLELNEELMKPEIISDVKETLKRTKEQALLKDAYEAYQKYKKLRLVCMMRKKCFMIRN